MWYKWYFFDSLKNDYSGFVNWYNNHLDRDVYVNQNTDGIRALLILKNDEQDEIKLKDNLLQKKPRILEVKDLEKGP